MIEPVIERHTADADAKRARVGEIGESPGVPGGSLLGENHLPLGPCNPCAQAGHAAPGCDECRAENQGADGASHPR